MLEIAGSSCVEWPRMLSQLSEWNPLALRLLNQLFDAATPFKVELETVPIRVSFLRPSGSKVPNPPPVGVDGAPLRTWPAPLEILAEWTGGSTSLRAQPALPGNRTYEGLICLQVATRSRGSLVWINLPTCLADSDDGVAQLLALTALVKRGDNAADSEALRAMVARAGLPFGSSKKVSLASIRVPEGEFITPPQQAVQNLATLCLLKLGLYSDEERDLDGEHFARYGKRKEEASQALDTVQATTHYGLIVPVLRALEQGAGHATALEERVRVQYGALLTPGDRRRKANGTVLWRYNVRWALSYLKQRGEAENPVRGQWAITAAGRERLRNEVQQFDIRTYQTLNAKVLSNDALAPSDTDESAQAEQAPPPAPWLSWHDRLSPVMSPELLTQLGARARPDLGPSPQEAIARNIIFVGPPGVGKTWLAEHVALALTGERPSAAGLVRLVQFHPSYGYEDFVWSIRPVLSSDKARFQEAPGPFFTLCKDALEEPDQLFVLIIDEINRGDPARIFGELLYALEYRGRDITLASGGSLTIPTNVVVLGTMNSVDRSVAMVDYALRRRFAFLRVDPNPKLVFQHHGTKVSFAAADALDQLNRAICEHGDADLQVGHSYFMGAGRALSTEADLSTIWSVDIAPQLAELFHGRSAILNELSTLWRNAIRTKLAEVDREAPEDDEVTEAAP